MSIIQKKAKKIREQKPGLPDMFREPSWMMVFFFAVILVVVYLSGNLLSTKKIVRYDLSYSEFIQQLDSGNVKSVLIEKLLVQGELKKDISIPAANDKETAKVRIFQTYLPAFQGEGILQKLRDQNVAVTIRPEEKPSLFEQFLLAVLPWALIIGVWIYVMKRSQKLQGGPGGLFTFGESKARLYDSSKPNITFKDVAGMDNVKTELRETIDFLKDPSKFRRLGAKVPKGVLLIGPPGTGKTLLARATAGEAGVPFFSISASEFIEMFVGVGASRVRDMFKKARAAQPSIIFIDEIDAVGRTRGAGLGGGHDEREQTLNQLLSEMDGFDPHEEVIVIAATNRPDVLDPALLRPGRFDRSIVIDRPGLKERKMILQVHVRNKILSEDVDLETIARGTPGLTGADLENIANEAALIAVRKNKQHVDMSDFEEARDIILMGSVREEPMSELERKITAYHEAGHALVAYSLPYTDPIHKISIIPRGMAMGVTQLIPAEDRHYYPRNYLMNRLSVALGGRGAERIIFNDISSGAQNDLKEASLLAEKMVAQWGMSDKVGPLNLGRGEEHPFLGRELAQPKRYSEDMAWLIDQEIQKLMLEAESVAVEILQNNKNTLIELAENLLVEEVLDKAAVEKIIEKSKRLS
ncbi:MAG TPA: ATP-dependent zinc metalloprotease FtsH [Dissulfurispiraceae bacterium]|nr:ATP-dependent zinc metalloprotease FtsH [Dissulfurispiraceae bacterium]